MKLRNTLTAAAACMTLASLNLSAFAEPITTTVSDSVIRSQKTGVTTTCVSDDDSPVWDENGHYRGTNAMYDAFLLITQMPKQQYGIGEPLDLSGMQVVAVEKRRFNTWHHDVSGEIDFVETDFDSTKAGTYSVKIGTCYESGDVSGLEPITFEVTVSEEMPVVTTFVSTESETEATSVCSAEDGAENSETDCSLYGDVNESGSVGIDDVIYLSRYVANDDKVLLSPQAVLMADVIADGILDMNDVTRILMYIGRMVTTVETLL